MFLISFHHPPITHNSFISSIQHSFPDAVLPPSLAERLLLRTQVELAGSLGRFPGGICAEVFHIVHFQADILIEVQG